MNDAEKQDAPRSPGNSMKDEARSLAAPVKDDLNRVGEDAAKLAEHAVDAIKKAADAFARQVGVTASDAVSTVRAVGSTTVDTLGAAAQETRAVTEEGFEALGRSVKRNPLTALAIAAGTGVLIGWMTGSDSRR